jgi:hypothetical protein
MYVTKNYHRVSRCLHMFHNFDIAYGHAKQLVTLLINCWSQDRVSSWYSDWLRAGRPRGWGSGRVKNFLFFTSSRPALGSTQLPIQWVLGVLSLGVKRPGPEADHSPPVSTEVKKMWIYTSTLQSAFMT